MLVIITIMIIIFYTIGIVKDRACRILPNTAIIANINIIPSEVRFPLGSWLHLRGFPNF